MTDIDDPRPRRFRSFVARPAPSPAPEPPVAEAPAPEEDLPTLTEIVAPDQEPPATPAIDPADLRAAIEDSLKRWIDDALLPQLLEKIEHGTRQKL